MPLCTAITDAGATTPRKMPHGWGWWHVECIAATIRADRGQPDLPFFEALGHTPHTVRTEVTYVDPADGEVLTLRVGDVLDAWRE